jgi:hypothetical protein
MSTLRKANCWEAKACGRQPGGARAAELGVCPAADDAGSHHVNGGQNAGRLCWAVAGTLCGGKVCGTMAEKRLTCLNCDFYKRVALEEGPGFLILRQGQAYQAHGPSDPGDDAYAQAIPRVRR